MNRFKIKFFQENGALAHSSALACQKRIELGIKPFITKVGERPDKFFWPGNSPLI